MAPGPGVKTEIEYVEEVIPRYRFPETEKTWKGFKNFLRSHVQGLRDIEDFTEYFILQHPSFQVMAFHPAFSEIGTTATTTTTWSSFNLADSDLLVDVRHRKIIIRDHQGTP